MSKFQDYLPQPFPVYRMLATHPDYPVELHYQNHRLNQCNGDLTTFRIVLPYDGTKIAFPSFVVRRPAGGASITTWNLGKVGGSISPTISGISSTIEALDTDGTWEAVIFPSQSFTRAVNTTDAYYIRFTDGVNSWYSEVFYFVDSPTISAVLPYSTMPNPCLNEEYIQLVWSNPGCVISEQFPMGAAFMLNLPANLASPTYNYKKETEEDGQGGQGTTFQRITKRWTFFVLAPEFIADALTAMQMFSDVGINFQYGDTLVCEDIEVNVDPQTACLSNVKVSFSSTFLAKTACCD